MSANLYARLMAMSVALIFWVTLVTALMVWGNVVHGLQPSVGWGEVHADWNHVNRYLWAMTTPLDRSILLFAWWSVPSSTAMSFVFLGFGEDALREYGKIGSAIVKIVSSRVLLNRDKKSPSGLGSVPFTMFQATPLTISDVALTDRPLRFRQMRRQRTKRSRGCCPFNPPDRCIP